MPKRDFYPKADAALVPFFDNFITQLGVVGTMVGVLPADITAMQGLRDDVNNDLAAKIARRAEAQSATAAFKATADLAEDGARGLVRRIKAHAAYTPAIGAQLGVEGPEESPGPEEEQQPDLAAVSALNGEVILTFAKKTFTGVEISSRRGSETEYTFLARDTEAPYVDTRANLAAGPETRYYRAQFLNKDQTVGQLSDVLVVTVPGNP